MSHHHSIRNLLNIKDKNINFDENFCSEETIKEVKSKVFYGTLTYQPKACYFVAMFLTNQIIKHGFKTSVIKMTSISGYHTYLKLRKQRYFCKHCHSTFTLKTNVVAKTAIFPIIRRWPLPLRRKIKSLKKILPKIIMYHHSTVNRIIDAFMTI